MIETKERVLSKLLSCQVATNLIGTDFNSVIVRSVQTRFEQHRGGLQVAFDISNHAVGKCNRTLKSYCGNWRRCAVSSWTTMTRRSKGVSSASRLREAVPEPFM